MASPMFLKQKGKAPIFTLSTSKAGSRGFMILAYAIVKFLEWKSLSRPRAGECYKKPLLDFLPGKELEAITLDDIVNYAHQVKERYSQTSYSYRMTILRGFIKYWYDRGVINLRPSLIEIPRYRMNPYKAVSELDFHVMDDFLDTEPDNFANQQKRLIIRFLWETGVRVSELCELQYRNLESCKCLIYNKKNFRQDWIFWSELTQILLDNFLTERKKYNGTSLFSTYEGDMSIRAVQRFIREICVQLNLPHYVAHSFRHGRAHYILKKGGDVKSIQSVLRHTNPVSSFRYLHLSEQETGDRARKFL